jgi:TetR/AcrR family transcriptional regulator, cholesterol catabolism regulator
MRKPKSENTEERILSAASRLFSEHGYKSTTLNDIAEQVGLHKTSLFHYFKSKEEILMRVMDESLRDHIPALKRIGDDPDLRPEEKLKLALKQQIVVLCTYRDHINVYLTEAKSLPLRKRERYNKTRKQYETFFEGIIRQVQEDKESNLFKGLDPRLVRLGILGMCNWIIKWYDENGGSTPEDIYKVFCSIIVGSDHKTK